VLSFWLFHSLNKTLLFYLSCLDCKLKGSILFTKRICPDVWFTLIKKEKVKLPLL